MSFTVIYGYVVPYEKLCYYLDPSLRELDEEARYNEMNELIRAHRDLLLNDTDRKHAPSPASKMPGLASRTDTTYVVRECSHDQTDAMGLDAHVIVGIKLFKINGTIPVTMMMRARARIQTIQTEACALGSLPDFGSLIQPQTPDIYFAQDMCTCCT
jgi:hypothetical protein